MHSITQMSQKLPQSTTDFLTRFISAVVPATVAECARSLNINVPPGTLNEFADRMSAELIDECNFDVDSDEEKSASNLVCMPAGAPVIDSEITHIQNLKLDLDRLYKEFKRDLIKTIANEIANASDSVKMEMRMEMHMEFEKAQAQAHARTQAHANANTNTHANANTNTNTHANTHANANAQTQAQPNTGFDRFVIESTSKVSPIMNGFESLKNTSNFNLDSDPLFQRVNKALERNKAGQASYTVEELIERRADRFDHAAAVDFRTRAAASKVEFDTSDATEDAREGVRWSRLMKEKYTAGL